MNPEQFNDCDPKGSPLSEQSQSACSHMFLKGQDPFYLLGSWLTT